VSWVQNVVRQFGFYLHGRRDWRGSRRQYERTPEGAPLVLRLFKAFGQRATPGSHVPRA